LNIYRRLLRSDRSSLFKTPDPIVINGDAEAT
jgi:hypothetical protein